LRAKGGPVRWVAPENIHLTVRFLGETDEARVPKLRSLIDSIAPAFAPADVLIDRLGGFPNLRKPRVIWAGLAAAEPVERMAQMARQVELAVRQLRFEPEKKGFQPHLTLGRVKDPRGMEQLAAFMESYRFTPLAVRLDRLVLFRSTLTPKGSIYERVHEAKLGDERLGG
ncbi:MAG TPA: RNA 2',3'-cyclic phosphodiesterase, partial [candidate division Zixibacteria bacterium]|nr:RNA 2',3'-cyclic phosphodiesterase [candidate division Zixibacteria bacterium]